MPKKRARVSRFKEDEINDLILNLEELLPDSQRRFNTRVPATKVLKKTCCYIKKLEKEVDCLSSKLSQLLDSEIVTGSIDANTVRSLFRHKEMQERKN